MGDIYYNGKIERRKEIPGSLSKLPLSSRIDSMPSAVPTDCKSGVPSLLTDMAGPSSNTQPQVLLSDSNLATPSLAVGSTTTSSEVPSMPAYIVAYSETGCMSDLSLPPPPSSEQLRIQLGDRNIEDDYISNPLSSPLNIVLNDTLNSPTDNTLGNNTPLCRPSRHQLYNLPDCHHAPDLRDDDIVSRGSSDLWVPVRIGTIDRHTDTSTAEAHATESLYTTGSSSSGVSELDASFVRHILDYGRAITTTESGSDDDGDNEFGLVLGDEALFSPTSLRSSSSDSLSSMRDCSIITKSTDFGSTDDVTSSVGNKVYASETIAANQKFYKLMKLDEESDNSDQLDTDTSRFSASLFSQIKEDDRMLKSLNIDYESCPNDSKGIHYEQSMTNVEQVKSETRVQMKAIHYELVKFKTANSLLEIPNQTKVTFVNDETVITSPSLMAASGRVVESIAVADSLNHTGVATIASNWFLKPKPNASRDINITGPLPPFDITEPEVREVNIPIRDGVRSSNQLLRSLSDTYAKSRPSESYSGQGCGPLPLKIARDFTVNTSARRHTSIDTTPLRLVEGRVELAAGETENVGEYEGRRIGATDTAEASRLHSDDNEEDEVSVLSFSSHAQKEEVATENDDNACFEKLVKLIEGEHIGNTVSDLKESDTTSPLTLIDELMANRYGILAVKDSIGERRGDVINDMEINRSGELKREKENKSTGLKYYNFPDNISEMSTPCTSELERCVGRRIGSLLDLNTEFCRIPRDTPRVMSTKKCNASSNNVASTSTQLPRGPIHNLPLSTYCNPTHSCSDTSTLKGSRDRMISVTPVVYSDTSSLRDHVATEVVDCSVRAAKDAVREVASRLVEPTNCNVSESINNTSTKNTTKCTTNETAIADHNRRSCDLLYKMYQNSFMTDFVIETKTDKFYVHAAIICCHSATFERVAMQGSRNVVFNDVDSTCMKHIIDFMYTGDFTLDETDRMLQLLAIKLISGKLRMRHLVKLCSEKMFTLDSVDALQVLVNTRSGFESENNLLKKIVLSDFENICCHENSENMSYALLCSLLADKQIDGEEMLKLRLIITWISFNILHWNEQNQPDKKKFVHLLGYVCFGAFTKSQHVAAVTMCEHLLQLPGVGQIVLVDKLFTDFGENRANSDLVAVGYDGEIDGTSEAAYAEERELKQRLREFIAREQTLASRHQLARMPVVSLFVVGKRGPSTCGFSYNPMNRQWIRGFEDSLRGLTDYSICIQEEFVYFSGGQYTEPTTGQKSNTNLVMRWSCNTHEWSMVGNMICLRQYHSSIVVGEYIYIIGGFHPIKRKLCPIERKNLNDKDSLFSFVSYLDVERAKFAVCKYNNGILICGGIGTILHYKKPPENSILNKVEYLNIDQINLNNSITTRCIPFPDMKIARHGHSVCCLGNRVYCMGGVGSSLELLTSVYSFEDNTTLQADAWWRPVADMPVAKRDFAILFENNQIHVLGGMSKDDLPSQTIQSYECATDLWYEDGEVVIPAGMTHPVALMVEL